MERRDGKKEIILEPKPKHDPRPDASGRKKPRAGSLGPNGTANAFLAGLRNKPIKIWLLDTGRGAIARGDLVEFDSYSIVIRDEANVLRLIFKGPGLVVEPA